MSELLKENLDIVKVDEPYLFYQIRLIFKPFASSEEKIFLRLIWRAHKNIKFNPSYCFNVDLDNTTILCPYIYFISEEEANKFLNENKEALEQLVKKELTGNQEILGFEVYECRKPAHDLVKVNLNESSAIAYATELFVKYSPNQLPDTILNRTGDTQRNYEFFKLAHIANSIFPLLKEEYPELENANMILNKQNKSIQISIKKNTLNSYVSIYNLSKFGFMGHFSDNCILDTDYLKLMNALKQDNKITLEKEEHTSTKPDFKLTFNDGSQGIYHITLSDGSYYYISYGANQELDMCPVHIVITKHLEQQPYEITEQSVKEVFSIPFKFVEEVKSLYDKVCACLKEAEDRAVPTMEWELDIDDIDESMEDEGYESIEDFIETEISYEARCKYFNLDPNKENLLWLSQEDITEEEGMTICECFCEYYKKEAEGKVYELTAQCRSYPGYGDKYVFKFKCVNGKPQYMEREGTPLGFDPDEVVETFKSAGIKLTYRKADEDDFEETWGYQYDDEDKLPLNAVIFTTVDYSNRDVDELSFWLQDGLFEGLDDLNGYQWDTPDEIIEHIFNEYPQEGTKRYTLNTEED